MHNCSLCQTEAIPERCLQFLFDWEEEDSSPILYTREAEYRILPPADAATILIRKPSTK